MNKDVKKALLISPEDNVANALEAIVPGDDALILPGAGNSVTATEEIPFGFKIAVRDIREGEAVIKYSEKIGLAGKDIRMGECVHIHNISGFRGRGDLLAGSGGGCE